MYADTDEKLVPCPYNRFHIINTLRIQKHINKCKKNYPDVKLATCLYNYTHRVKPEDMLKHYEICPQRMRVEVSRDIEFDCKDGSFNMPTKAPKGDKNFYMLGPQNRDTSTKGFQNVKHSLKSNLESNSPKIPEVKAANKKKGQNRMKSPDEELYFEEKLKPLPLPKTTSKAFVTDDIGSVYSFKSGSSLSKEFENASNMPKTSTPGPAVLANQFLPDADNDRGKEQNSSFITKDGRTSPSGSSISSFLDDESALESVGDLLEDLDDIDSKTENEEEPSYVNFIAKRISKYSKLEDSNWKE